MFAVPVCCEGDRNGSGGCPVMVCPANRATNEYVPVCSGVIVKYPAPTGSDLIGPWVCFVPSGFVMSMKNFHLSPAAPEAVGG